MLKLRDYFCAEKVPVTPAELFLLRLMVREARMRQQNLSLENQIDFLFWFREKLKQMTLEEQIQYWVDIAESDVPVAKNLFENGHFIYCLFFGHLILEKIIK